MNQTLLKFLTEHQENGVIWFIVPGGIVMGILDTLDSREPETVTLRQGSIRRGEWLEEVDAIHVTVQQISAWGENPGKE